MTTGAPHRAPTPAEASHGWVVSRTTGPGFRTAIAAGPHVVHADEPRAVGGDDTGPTPYDLLLAAIGGCMAMTIRMYVRRKGWPLEEASVALRASRDHGVDCADCTTSDRELAPLRLERRIELRGALTEEQRARILAVADRCPVKQALRHGVEITPVD